MATEDDSHYWNIISEELKSRSLNEGLWLKVRTLCVGTQEELERQYVVMRLEQLKEESRRAEKKQESLLLRASATINPGSEKTLGSAWEKLAAGVRSVPDMSHIATNSFVGSKADLVNPRRLDFVSGESGLQPELIVDAIKAKIVSGIFDGQWWWIDIA